MDNSRGTTDSTILYQTLFRALGYDDNNNNADAETTKEAELAFLIEHHTHDSELDRNFDIQYTFCSLWRTILDDLWEHRRNTTHSLPIHIKLPLRDDDLHTDSPFVYYVDQLHYTADAYLSTVFRAIFPSHYYRHPGKSMPRTHLLNPSALAVDTMKAHIIRAQGVIFLINEFDSTYVTSIYSVFNGSSIPVTYKNTVLDSLMIKFHMIRVVCYWFSACCHLTSTRGGGGGGVMEGRGRGGDGGDTDEDAASRFAGMRSIIRTSLLDGVNAYETIHDQRVFQNGYGARFEQLDDSAHVQIILAKARYQYNIKQYHSACLCWDYVQTKYGYELTRLQIDLIKNHPLGEDKENKVTPETIYNMKPMCDPCLNMFLSGRPIQQQQPTSNKKHLSLSSSS